jgi:hypothetical protein
LLDAAFADCPISSGPQSPSVMVRSVDCDLLDESAGAALPAGIRRPH